MTVLAPSPVNPASRPLTSKRRTRPGALERRVAALAKELWRTELLAIARLVERQALPLGPFLVAKRPDRVVEAGDLDAPAAILHLRQDLRQHHRRVCDGAAERSRMQIALRAAEIDLAVDEAAQPVANRRDAAIEHRRIRDHDDVGAELALVGLDEVVEVRRADFFLAFEDDLHVDRQLAGLLQVRLDGLEVHEHLALVVGRSARVDLAVADGRLKGRRLPQLDRIDRLHVVVAVEKDRRRAFGAKPVAIDDGIARRLDQADVGRGRCGASRRRSTRRSAARRPRAAAGR